MHVRLAMGAFVLPSDFAENSDFATTAMTNHIQKITNKGRYKQSTVSEETPIGDFGRQLKALLLAQYPHARIRNARYSSRAAFSNRLAGFTLEHRTASHLVLAAGPEPGNPAFDTILATGLSWLLRSNSKSLWLLHPAGQATATLNRLSLMKADSVRCFEYDPAFERLYSTRPFSQSELFSRPVGELHWPDPDAVFPDWSRGITDLAPKSINTSYRNGAINYSIKGLRFASIPVRNTSHSPQPGYLEYLDNSLVPTRGLKDLVAEILIKRSWDSPDKTHPLYRLQPEAWLEAGLRHQLENFGIGIDPRFVYTQIPAWIGGDRSVIDILSITTEGRLVIVEVKATEDLNLPMQGLDYWLAIEHSRLRGDLERHSLFRGCRILDLPPVLYLAAPVLRFHRSFAGICKLMKPEIEVYQMGVNSTWRREVKLRKLCRLN